MDFCSHDIWNIVVAAYDNLQEWNKSTHQILSRAALREEFGTVTLALPRRCGKSTAVVTMLDEWESAVCIVPNISMEGLIRERVRFDVGNIYSQPHQLEDLSLSGLQLLILDEAGHFDTRLRRATQSLISKLDPTTLVVKIGT